MDQGHILVVDDNQMAAKMVAELLTRRDYMVTVKTKSVEALAWLQVPGNAPDLIVLDLMMPEMNGYEFLRHVRADPTLAYLPVILLTAKSQVDDKVAGFEAGADDYLVKPVNPVELEARIKSLMARRQVTTTVKPTAAAHVVSVFSLRGGVGTTSIAVNLAIALASLWEIEVPLVDLALKNGHCGLMLDLKPKYTLASVVGWEEDTLDPEVMNSLFAPHATGVNLLTSATSPVEAELITPQILDRVWPHLRGQYRYVVIDAGSELSELAITVLERSRTLLLMLTPELAALRAATDVLRILESLDYPLSRIVPVVNWIFPRDGLPQKSIENALGQQVKAVLPYERTAFVRAINSGRPLMATQPTAGASMVIARLAYQLSSADMESTEISHPSQLLTAVRQLNKAR